MLKNLLIDVWNWDWDLYPKLILKGRDGPSFSQALISAHGGHDPKAGDVNSCSTNSSELIFQFSLQHLQAAFLFTSSNFIRKWKLLLVWSQCSLGDSTPGLHPFRFRQCAYPWKGFRQTCYQRLSHHSFLFFLTKQSKVCFHLCKNHI